MSKTIDIIKKFSDRYLNSKIIFTIDVILSAISSALVLLLAFFVVRSDVISREFSITYLISSVLASVLMFYITKTYRIIIRHLSVRDIGVFFVAGLGKVLLTALVMVRYRELTTLWISLTADFLFTTFLLVGTRMVMIFAYQFFIHKGISSSRRRSSQFFPPWAMSSLFFSRIRHSSLSSAVRSFCMQPRVS